MLSAPTLRAGLEATEVPRSTWHGWLADPRVRTAWQRLQREVFVEALADLKGGSRFAVTGLLGLMASKKECREVLAVGIKGAEMGELTERLERLEAALAPLIAAADL